ncbi:MAG: GAF domain-containing protein [Cyanobacteria bacterium]|nr:GAF domain-containing protein [Cyanobacteriota bacterium]
MIERDGRRSSMMLTPAVVANPSEPARTISLACVAGAWAAIGLIVIAMRPTDRASQYCAGFMILAAASQLGVSLADIDHPAGPVHTVVRFAGFAAYPWHIVCCFMMAVTVASTALPFSRTAIVGAAAIYTTASIPRLIELLDPAVVASVSDVSRGWQGIIGRFVIVAGLFCTVASLALAHRRLESIVTRRRIRWMVAGLLPAATAYSFTAALSVVARTRPELAPIYDTAIIVTLFVSLSVPIAFAYAVARHELFGVRLVIRMSIRYALARTALLWMLAVPLLGLAWTIWSEPELTVRGLLSAGRPHFYLLIVIGISLAMRERLLAAIDRRFFRDARDRERILIELASDIGRTDTVAEAAELVERAVKASLHPESIRVQLHDTAKSFPADLPTTDTLLLQKLEAGEEIEPNEKDVAIVVPIMSHERRLMGTLLLGAKRSEEPYSADDLKLLRAVARQVAMAVENAALRREVAPSVESVTTY